MNAREGEALTTVGVEVVVDRPYLACLHVGPAHEPHVVVEKQVADRLALTHEQGGIISGAIVEGTQVGIAEDVDVMHEHRTVGIEERSRLAQSASRLEQHVALVRHQELHTLHGLGVQVVDNLVGEVVHVDHRPAKTCIVEPLRHMAQERLIAHGHQSLGHGVGEWPQAGA